MCAALRVFAVPRLRCIPVLKANAKVFFSHTFINNRGSNALLSELVHVLSECLTINAQERDDVLLRQQSVTHFHDWPWFICFLCHIQRCHLVMLNWNSIYAVWFPFFTLWFKVLLSLALRNIKYYNHYGVSGDWAYGICPLSKVNISLGISLI